MAIILFAVILGGIGTPEGPIVGVAVYFLLRETTGNIGLGLLAIGVTYDVAEAARTERRGS
jgi:branched-chain amino acid transport system permease protein